MKDGTVEILKNMYEEAEKLKESAESTYQMNQTNNISEHIYDYLVVMMDEKKRVDENE